MIRTGTPHCALDLGGKGRAVAGLAHRGGGDDREMIDAERPRQRDEALQIGEASATPSRVQPAGRGDAAAERRT